MIMKNPVFLITNKSTFELWKSCLDTHVIWTQNKVVGTSIQKEKMGGTIFSDGMCLRYAASRNVYLVQGLGLCTLSWDMDRLLCAVTLSDKEDNVSSF